MLWTQEGGNKETLMYYTYNYKILLKNVFKKISPASLEAFEVFCSTFSDTNELNGKPFHHHSCNSSITSENLDGQAG